MEGEKGELAVDFFGCAVLPMDLRARRKVSEFVDPELRRTWAAGGAPDAERQLGVYRPDRRSIVKQS
jgi:hypothetical protein